MPTDTSSNGGRPAQASRPLRRVAHLPGPKGWPLVGSLPQLDPPVFRLQLGQWAREFGRFYRLRLGPR